VSVSRTKTLVHIECMFLSKTALFYTETSDVRHIVYLSDSCSFETHLPGQKLKHRTKCKPYANSET